MIQYCFIVTSDKVKFEELQVGQREKTLWPQLKHPFEVRRDFFTVQFSFIICHPNSSSATTA